MRRAILARLSQDEKETLGIMFLFSGLAVIGKFATLEPPWKNNEKKTSCIPAGGYLCTPRTSPKFGDHFILHGVDGRDFILIHKGNYSTDTEGCILLGYEHADINRDGVIDVTRSGAALAFLNNIQNGEAFSLAVVDPGPKA